MKILPTGVPNRVREANGSILHYKVLPLGGWNMDTLHTQFYVHGLDLLKIVNVIVLVINDTGLPRYVDHLMESTNIGGDKQPAGFASVSATDVEVYIKVGSFFDSADYDDNTINRGWIYLTYME